VLLVIAYLAYSVPGMSRPWGNDHNGFLAKEKAAFAIDYLRLGLWHTGLGQRMDEGGTIDSALKRYSYYVRHPAGISLLTAGSFFLFGITEWASRLVAILLNVGILLALYRFFGTYWDGAIAQLALFFVVGSPMMFYSRHLLAFELLALFFMSVALSLYATWQVTGRPHALVLLIGTLLVGMLFGDWQVYFLVPSLVVHHLLFTNAPDRKIFLLAPLPGLAFLVYLAYVRWLTGSVGGEGTGGLLWANMLLRMNLSQHAASANITVSKWVRFLLGHYDYFYTPVLGVFMLVFLASCALTLARRERLTAQEGLILCYILGIVAYFAVFSHAFMCCEFMLLFFLPVSGVVASSVLVGHLRLVVCRANSWVRRMVFVAVLGSCCAAVLVFAYPQARRFYLMQNRDLPLNSFFARHHDDVIVTFDEDASFYQLRPYLQLRTVRRVWGVDELRRVLEEGRGRFGYVVIKKDSPPDQRLWALLVARYASQRIGNSPQEEYEVFDVRRTVR